MTSGKILIVDDDASIRNLLSLALSRHGYEVLEAKGAEKALEILENEKIPIIFIDLGLETMDGFELCEIVRKDHANAIIYALSGYVNLFEPQDFKEAGFNGFEAKPIIMENIFKIVKDSFEQIDRLIKNSYVREIKRILIVDDEEQIRKMLSKMLEMEGYIVSDASSAEEGYLRFSEQPADLIITDLVMPGKSGIDMALNIKEENPDVNIILMSGCGWYGIEAEFDVAKALGAITLKKPIGRKAILRSIRQIQN